MRRGWLLRLKAALLTTVILAGGGGMPHLDAALYHGFGSPHAALPHFETHTPRGHGDICNLSSALSPCPQLASLGSDVIIGPLTFVQPRLPVVAPRSAHSGILPHPRAPPVSLV